MEGGAHTRDAELLRLRRQLDNSCGADSEEAARARDLQEAFQRVDVQLAGMRQRLLQASAAIEAKVGRCCSQGQPEA
jgi:hypothetical protein